MSKTVDTEGNEYYTPEGLDSHVGYNLQLLAGVAMTEAETRRVNAMAELLGTARVALFVLTITACVATLWSFA